MAFRPNLIVDRYATAVLSAQMALRAAHAMNPTRNVTSHGWDVRRLRLVATCVPTAAIHASTSTAPAALVRLKSLLLLRTSRGASSTKPHTPSARSHVATRRKTSDR